MQESSTPELPGWNIEVHESSISRDHVHLEIATRIPKDKLEKLGPGFVNNLTNALYREFENVLLDG